MTYQEENNILLNKTYEEYFYNNWKNKENPKSIEFIFSPYCNLKCKYCYLNHHYDEQFPLQNFNAEKSIDNAVQRIRKKLSALSQSNQATSGDAPVQQYIIKCPSSLNQSERNIYEVSVKVRPGASLKSKRG